MNRKKVLIVDDERSARNELILLLKPFSEIKIVGEADNIDNAVSLIIKEKPDIVFLDVQLTGENGFDLLNRVAVDFKVIFVTAYNEYAVRAFDVNAADYLLKPVDPARLELSIKKISNKSESDHSGSKKFDYSDSVYIRLNNHTARFVALNTIVVITSVGNYSKLKTADANHYLVLKTLNQWEKDLPHEYFIRIHRATIVNLKYITRIETYSDIYHRAYLHKIEEPFDISRDNFKKIKKKGI